MTKNLIEVMSGKSDEGLMDCLTNSNKYTPEAISAALTELKKRGRSFSDEELKEIKIKFENRVEAEKAEKEGGNLFGNESWKKNIVTDPNAPLLYSKRAIWGFSVFFSSIFGAVLLASNINSNKKWMVVGFGIVYAAISIFILNQIPPNTTFTFILNAAGGLALTTTFWDKYIGKETKFRVKPIWKPLIISIIIIIPIILAMIYA